MLKRLGIAFCALFVCSLAAPPAHAASLVLLVSGYCLGPIGNGIQSGTAIQLIAGADCAHVQWEIYDGNIELEGQTDKCLNPSGNSTADGTSLVVSSCYTSTNPASSWTLTNRGLLMRGGKCIGATRESGGPPIPIVLYACPAASDKTPTYLHWWVK